MQSDYVRMKCFELVVKEIRKRNTPGATAELGVFKGEFAQYINWAFPDKKLYLFDTFEGFDAEEASKEVRSGNATDAFVEAYKQTSIDEVIEKMSYLDKIEIKQGYFPASLGGLEETFAFVSIDVDFEDSVYEGLKYFYTRLSEGGYIFVHDYNSSLRGVERAVDRFEKEMNGRICKMPLCDANGTLVIGK
ncbi:MAG: TylF/MycF family methyltransferase [Eubacterium sp.]|nr:TylF/MycF family methyltransferase [Eubacterium sp.]